MAEFVFWKAVLCNIDLSPDFFILHLEPLYPNRLRWNGCRYRDGGLRAAVAFLRCLCRLRHRSGLCGDRFKEADLVGLFSPRMLRRSRYGIFGVGFRVCFDATMKRPGEGPFALTKNVNEETARRKAEEDEGREAEGWRQRGSRVEFEHMRATGTGATEHAVFGRVTFQRLITMHHACTYGGTSWPGVELKYLCNNVGCKAEKKGNFW